MKYSLRTLPVSVKPKLRWYQFSIRWLLVAVTCIALTIGVSTAWLSHRDFCLSRASEYAVQQSFVRGELVSVEPLQFVFENKKEEEIDNILLNIEQAYRRAVWRPWDRIWIKDVLLEDL